MLPIEVTALREQLAQQGVTLVAVSKTQPIDKIQALYEAGQRVFGENRVQELTAKYEQLPQDIEWHLIGHLQTNKVKYIAPFVQLIHSVDSLHLLVEINKQAAKCGRVIRCLLQFWVAQEETKFGLTWQEATELLQSPQFANLHNVEIVGIMGMASITDDAAQTRREFDQLRSYFEQLRQQFFSQQASFSTVSMGMSGDYRMAIEAGSTMVRLGTLLF